MCFFGCVCVWYHQEIKWKNRGEDNKERERENDTAQPRKQTNKKKNQSNNSNENRELASTVTISQQSRNDFPFGSIKEEILCLFVCKWIHLQKLTLEPYRITGYTKNKRHRGHWISVKQLITNLFDLTWLRLTMKQTIIIVKDLMKMRNGLATFGAVSSAMNKYGITIFSVNKLSTGLSTDWIWLVVDKVIRCETLILTIFP